MSWELGRYLAFQDKVNVVLSEIRYGDEYEIEHEPWAVRETVVKIDRILDEYANDPETMKKKIDVELERGWRMYLFEKKAPQLCWGISTSSPSSTPPQKTPSGTRTTRINPETCTPRIDRFGSLTRVLRRSRGRK